MAFDYRLPFNAASTTSIASGQTLAAAGNLVLNGPLAQTLTPNDGGTISFFAPVVTASDVTVGGGYNVPVTLSSTGNLSGVNFTITGYTKNPYNPFTPTTEVLAGPSNDTVTSVNFYNRILSIHASAAVGTNVSAGTSGTNAVSNWLPVMGPGASMPIAIGIAVTGTINYTVQHTFDNVFDSTITPVAFNCDDSTVVNATASADTNYVAPPRAVRILINSGSGSLIFWVIQNGLTSP